ncbi:MAG: aminotransferase class V-fold PLP-dependent enzyme [Micromonosporaceae bacterium]
MELSGARELWDAEPGYLNTASYGLPPRPAWDELQRALADWRVGRTSWEVWSEATDRSRAVFARILGVPAADVAVGATVSQLLAPLAAALPDGARVVAPTGEFSSTLFPWMAQAHRGVVTRTVPLSDLPDAVDETTDLVAFSLVQSADGAVAPYRRLVEAARAYGATVVVDATQACGWLPFEAALADVVVVAAYKWLMSPRGSAFAYLAPQVREGMTPHAANWCAAEDVHASYYGPPMRLAGDARRFDISPAWFSWVGTAPALEVVERIGVAAIHDHNVRLANRFLTALGRPPGDSAIVTVEVPGAAERLAAAGVRTAVRAGRVRASFHVYNTDADVDAAVAALTG